MNSKIRYTIHTLRIYIDREPTLRTKPSKLTIVFVLDLHIDL
jgi:hypothetical protein